MLVPQLPTASPPLQLTELTLVWHGGAWTLPRLSWTRPDHHREDRKRARPRPEYCLVQSLTIVRVIPGSHGRYYCATSNTFSHLNGLPSVTVSVVIVVDFLVRLLFLSRSLLQTSPGLSHQDGDLSTILTAIKDQKVFQSMPCMALEVPHECLPRCPSTSPWHKSSITFSRSSKKQSRLGCQVGRCTPAKHQNMWMTGSDGEDREAAGPSQGGSAEAEWPGPVFRMSYDLRNNALSWVFPGATAPECDAESDAVLSAVWALQCAAVAAPSRCALDRLMAAYFCCEPSRLEFNRKRRESRFSGGQSLPEVRDAFPETGEEWEEGGGMG